MKNKRTTFLLFLLVALLTFTLIFAVACSQRTTEEEEDDGSSGGSTKPTMTFEQYMSKVNAGLKAGETRLGEMTDYYVASEYTIYTRVENLTVTYEAVYRENRRDGNYYIRIFDNGNHIERLNLYYNGSSLFVTVRDKHYRIENFGTLMLFDTFSSFLDVLDIGEYVYGEQMQTYLSPTSPISFIVGVNDFTYAKAGEGGESITLKGDFSAVIGVANATLTGLAEKFGTVLDAPVNHYLGFELSKLVNMAFNSLSIDEMRFNLESSVLTNTTMQIGGRMQDQSAYKVNAAYAYNEETKVITKANGITTKYEYEDVTPGTGAFDGTAYIYNNDNDLSTHQFSADYDINAKTNETNKFTVRLYDQMATALEYTAETKYNNVNELLSAYYRDEILYVNTQGVYDFFNMAISLSALRLPKVMFTGFNLKGAMSLIYSDLLQMLDAMLDTETEKEEESGRTAQALLDAMKSDVEKQEISITVTEELFRNIRGENVGLSEFVASLLNVDKELLDQYLGPDFFEQFRIILRYNFGTGHLFVDVYKLDTHLIELDITKAEYFGVVFPSDLNDLTYTELVSPEVITLTFAMEFSPYGAPEVDVSGFFGSFIGDSTGKNTPQTLTIGQTIVAEGRVSEYSQTNYAGEKENVTTMDMRIYITSNSGQDRTLWMTIATDPTSRTASELLVRACFPMGNYTGTDDIYFKIDRKVVTDELNKLTDGDSALSEQSPLAIFLSLYGAANHSSKTYTQDGYFCVDFMIMDGKDPIKELIGIENLVGRIKCKVGFDNLDLSGIDADAYPVPYVHTVDDVSKDSIYSKGSAWKETMEVTVGGKRVEFLATYDPQTTEIVTGKTSYSPTAYIFGKEFSYAFNIVTKTGTYKVRTVEITDDLIVIDPVFGGIPKTVGVTFEGAEAGKLECTIEGFKEEWVTNDGYNLALLNGERTGISTYRLIIGKDSIATIEKDVYIAVICRKVISVTDSSGNEEKYVKEGRQIPIVAEFIADPYTYAMEKKIAQDAGQTYDYLKKALEESRTVLQFDNLYGVITEKDVTTGEDVETELRYDEEGYNWFYLAELDLDWDFPTTEFSWRGETRYAVAAFGTNEGRTVEIAIRVSVSGKEVQTVKIDDFTEGTYTIDYLKKSTYDIPTVTADGHTVSIIFKDGTSRIVVRGKPSAMITDEVYCREYVYGQLIWEGADGVAAKLEEQGTMSLFGTGAKANNDTSALFGGDILGSTQTVKLSVIAPSRFISGRDYVSMYLIPSIDEEGNPASPTSIQVTKVARFTKTTEEPSNTVESFAFNPYDSTVVLPDTIWLYVNMTSRDTGAKAWVEYPVEWVTTDKATVDEDGNVISGNELNIIKLNEQGKYYPINRTNDETRRVVYGRVGVHDAEYDRRIWVTMSIVNLQSNIKDYTLYLPNGEMFNKERTPDGRIVEKSATISIDPYLSYVKNLPSYFEAVLGSGETIPHMETDWYCGDYPIQRYDKDGNVKEVVASHAFDVLYDENGYYVFPKTGGTYSLWMNVSAGEENSVSNYIYVEATVNARTLYAEYDGENEKISDYIDIFRRVKERDEKGNVISYYGDNGSETYTGTASAGYTEINYYVASSAELLARIEELIENDGVGTAGVSFVQTQERGILYAKEIAWDLSTLRALRDSLKKVSPKMSFEGNGALVGVMDKDNINSTQVMVRFTISERTQSLVSVALTNAKSMTDQGVYKIKSDTNGDNSILIGTTTENEYASRLTDGAYYRSEQYKTYFDTDVNYQDEGYDGVIYFVVNKTFMLSKTGNGFYTSPYEYFTYLFSNMRLEFASMYIDGAAARISTGNKSIFYFNNSVLGFNDNMIETDSVTGWLKSYSFLILERFSQGSAVERTLVIIEAVVATPAELTREDRIDAFQNDLTEKYSEDNPFELPDYVEVQFRIENSGGEYYIAKYEVSGWESLSYAFGETDSSNMTEIGNEYINVMRGSKYDFKFTLPDMDTQQNDRKEFMYSVIFNQKDIGGTNYNAQAANSLYNIVDGTITVTNSYTFLTPKADGRYSFDLNQVPRTITMTNETGRYQSTGTDVFALTKWSFDENATIFNEEIFSKGTAGVFGTNDGVVIARYTFNSFYQAGEQVTQTVELRLILPAMKFYALEAESDDVPLDVVLDQTDTGENPTYNTIVIDPYVRTTGNLRLPTVVTVVFNGTQRYTTAEVSFYLVNEFTGYAMSRAITYVSYDEKGHTLTESYTPNPQLLKLEMRVRGYTQTGIRINIRFLQRSISDVKLPNYYYDDEGARQYETKNGETVFENGEPVWKEYYAYAEYAFRANASQTNSEEGFMPIYYIDPYNTATFALPTKAWFEFNETAAGVYLNYSVTGWQYYSEELKQYVYFPSEQQQTDSDRFYREYDEKDDIYRCYFRPDEESSKGAFYVLRGYVQVGDKEQYFDVVCIVLNRSLKAGVVLDEQYTVSYDFSDPVAALLTDIPSILGENAFVTYDVYNREFLTAAKRERGEGTFTFYVSEDDMFSQKENGVAKNHPVVPHILWKGEYDLDGDGVAETKFEELTDVGFDGEIEGNLYYEDNYLKTLFDFYGKKAESDYRVLSRARVWDGFFSKSGTVSIAYSDTARNAIEEEAKKLANEVLYDTYNGILETVGEEEDIAAYKVLSDANKQTLRNALFISATEEYKLQNSISMIEEDDLDAWIAVVCGVYEKVSAAKAAWIAGGQNVDNINSQVEICLVWDYAIEEYTGHDAVTTRDVTEYQKRKEQHFLKIYTAGGKLGTDELARVTSNLNATYASLYININVDIWNDVYAVANAGERAVMDRYATKYHTVDETSGISMACDALRASISEENEIGARGEEAKAEATMPVISFTSMSVNGEQTTTINFNKFNFASESKTFSITFDVDYTAIYARMEEEARERAIKQDSDNKKADVLTAYETSAIKDAVNAAVPKEANKDGEYEVIVGMRSSAADPSTGFNYDYWKAGTQSNLYDTYWANLLDYRYNDAVKVIYNNLEESSIDTYEEVMATTAISPEEWASIKYAFINIKAPQMAQAYATYLEGKFDMSTEEGRKAATEDLIAYVLDNDDDIITRYGAFSVLGIEGTGSDDYVVDTAGWNGIKASFAGEMKEIATDVIAGYDSFYKTSLGAANRASAMKALATYSVTEDKEIEDLNAIYSDAEKEKKIEMAQIILAFNVNNTSITGALANIGKENNAYLQGSTVGNNDVGNAIVLQDAYGDVLNILYDIIMEPTREGSPLGYSVKTQNGLSDLRDKYTVNKYSFDPDGPTYKAIMLYIALNGRETANMGEIQVDSDIREFSQFALELVTAYLTGGKSPYDLLLEDPSMTIFTAEEIESYVGGELSPDCLLYHTTVNDSYINVLKLFAGRLNVTEKRIELAAKRYALYKAIYNSLSGTDREQLDAQRNEAKRDRYYYAAQAILASASDDTKSYLNNYIHSGTPGLEATAFVSLFTREEAKGKAKGEVYKEYRDEYVADNEYKYSIDLIVQLEENYIAALSGSQNLNNVEHKSYIALNVYAPYFAPLGVEEYAGREDYISNTDFLYTSESALTGRLRLAVTYNDDRVDEDGVALLNKYKVTAADDTVVGERYLKDIFLQTIVYFYENIATDDQKIIIEEVAETYTGLDAEGELEKSFVKAAVAGRLNGNTDQGGNTVYVSGKTMFDDLLTRDDMGFDLEEQFTMCYYAVWLQNMTKDTEYAVWHYPADVIKTKNPYTSTLKPASTDALVAAYGESPLPSDLEEVAKTLAVNASRRGMFDVMKNSIEYDTAYENTVVSEINDLAMKYAYDRVYNGEGGIYVSVFDEILTALVGQGSEVDELTFKEMQQAVLDGKLLTLEKAVTNAVRVSLYAEMYDEIELLSMTAEEFAGKAYRFLKGQDTDDPVTTMFGTQDNALGGIVGDVLEDYRNKNGEISPGSEADVITVKLTDWWTLGDNPEDPTMYGNLSTEERAFIEQIYSQAKYQVTSLVESSSFASEARAELAYTTMLSTMYLFLVDLAEYVETNVPKEYLAEGNEKEYKAFVIRSLLESDVMKQEGHNMTLAQATLASLLYSASEERAKTFYHIYKEADLRTTCEDTEGYLALITDYLISTKNPVFTGTEEALYRKYITKAMEYVEYTSIAGSSEYTTSADPVADNPLRAYADEVSLKVTGNRRGESGAPSGLSEYQFGMQTFGQIYTTNGSYGAALEALLSGSRSVTTTYYSEDHAAKGEKHVLYFDRIEWDEAKASGTTANANYNNKNLFFSNSLKTEKGTDVSGGYGYSSSIRTSGVRYMISDITEVTLYFYGTEQESNALAIDALAPELPTKVYAVGTIGQNNANPIEVELGEVEIMEYSSEFRKLVYSGTGEFDPDVLDTKMVEIRTGDKTDKINCIKNSAYYVIIKAANGDTFTVQNLFVGYLNRGVEEMYLYPTVRDDMEEATYAFEKQVVDIIDTGDFVDMYSLHNETKNTNVMYVDPTDEELLLSAQKTYILPKTLAVRSGQGSKILFTDVEWDLSGVAYGLEGTGDNGVAVPILSYGYEDSNGYKRVIRYDYAEGKAYMYVYEDGNIEDTTVVPAVYDITETIDWNVRLVVKNRTLTTIRVPAGDAYEELGSIQGSVIDATGWTTKINPYYPELPLKMRLSLGTKDVQIELNSQSDWVKDMTLLKPIMLDSNDNRYFTATFVYLGYTIKVRFEAMDIHVMTAEDIRETAEAEPYNGGVIYFVRGEGDARQQFEENYSLMYFNFGDEDAPNWQKVPVALRNYAAINMGTDREQTVDGIIGGFDDANAVFTVRVVDFSTYAWLNEQDNYFVRYDYYSVATDNGERVNISAGDRDGMTGRFFLTKEATERGEGEELFLVNTNNGKTEYSVVNKKIRLTLRYEYDSDVSEKLAFNASGDRVREYKVSAPMWTYERSDITNLEFALDETDTTWTKVNVIGVDDAIYWPIGTPLGTNDLPKLVDRETGAVVYPLWDLTNFNVNEANVAVAGEIRDGDGVYITGWYLTKNNTWEGKRLRVLIQKTDIRGQFIEAVGGNEYINKTYDAQYFDLYEGMAEGETILRLLRRDGTKEEFTTDDFVVTYYKENELTGEMTPLAEGELPLNAGRYYIIVALRAEDYNVYISEGAGWMYSLRIAPYSIVMDEVMFVGEQANTVSRVYGATGEYLVVVGGLPEFTPANWFASGEKQALFDSFKDQGYSDEAAKVEVYKLINKRVTSYVSEVVIGGWYVEGYEALSTDFTFMALETAEERANKVMAWVFDNRMTESLTIREVGVEITYSLDGEELERAPRDVGSYYVTVALQENENYVPVGQKSLRLVVAQNESIVYAPVNTTLTYSGGPQNLEISGLHMNGVVPVGVTVTYDYTIVGDDEEDDKRLVVIVQGTTDQDGNSINQTRIDLERTTLPNPTSGIKDVGVYICTITIEGGRNYVSGTLNNVSVTVSPASIYILLEDVAAVYLDPVANLAQRIRIYNESGDEQAAGVLLGTDRISDLGSIVTRTPVRSHYKTGTYYMYIDGLKLSSAETYVYTEKNGTKYWNGEEYSLLALKSYEMNGSLYKDYDNNKAVIDLFNNYNIYVKTHTYPNSDQTEGAAGRYRIALKDDLGDATMVVSVSSNEELAEVINGLRDGDNVAVYLAPLTDGTGAPAAYDAFAVNGNAEYGINATLTLLADDGETVYVKGFVLYGGTLRLRDLVIQIPQSEGTGIVAWSNAGNVDIEDCTFENATGVTDTIGIHTLEGYSGKLFLVNTSFVVETPYIMEVGAGREIGGIEAEISKKTDLSAYIGSLRDGNKIKIYLAPVYNAGVLSAYDEITINVAADVTIVGYRSNETNVIESVIRGVNVLKGTFRMSIVRVVPNVSGGIGMYVGDDTNYVEINDCVFEGTNGITNLTGIRTSINYKNNLCVYGTEFNGLSMAVYFVGGELEIETSTFYKNYSAIAVTKASRSISIKTSLFSNNTGTAIRSVTNSMTVRENTFEYNGRAMELPEGSSIRENVNNGNVYTFNGDD